MHACIYVEWVGTFICVCVRVCVCRVCPLPPPRLRLFPHLVNEIDGREAPALGLTHEVRVPPAVGPQQVDVDGHGLRRVCALGWSTCVVQGRGGWR